MKLLDILKGTKAENNVTHREERGLSRLGLKVILEGFEEIKLELRRFKKGEGEMGTLSRCWDVHLHHDTSCWSSRCILCKDLCLTTYI